jgi:hypothetical protein
VPDSFACWLQRHAALVSSITSTHPVTISNWMGSDVLSWNDHVRAAEQLLEQAILLATALPAQQQQQPNISSINMVADPATLHVSPAYSVTKLSYQYLPYKDSSFSASAGLAKLSNLQQLQIQTKYDIFNPGSFLPGIAQLSRLTSLQLDNLDKYKWPESPLGEADAQALQQLLAQPLRVLRLSNSKGIPELDLSSLNRLQVFSGSCSYGLDAIFPPQLEQLELDSTRTSTVEALLELGRLRRLTVTADDLEAASLLRLTQLPALQHLSLVHGNFSCDVGTAAVWPQLSQLIELVVVPQRDQWASSLWPPSRQQLQGILEGVAASTNLTSLQLEAMCQDAEAIYPIAEEDDAEDGDTEDAEDGDTEDEEEENAEDYFGGPVTACAQLAGLTKLQHLRFAANCTLAPGDALALTALTGLTSLMRLVWVLVWVMLQQQQ